MNYIKFLFAIILLTACTNKKSNKSEIHHSASFDTIIKHDTIYFSNYRDWQEGFGLTHNPDKDSIWNKPVSYYINDKDCSGLAIDFYYGELRPSDNGITSELLKLVSTDNNKLRPFYRWCLNKTIQIQDGALGEYTGVPARKYAEKFPEEFFEYMDYDTTNEKYLEWVNCILYSGFYDEDNYQNPKEIRIRMSQTMKKNCKNCSEKLNKRIDKFSKDCF